MNVPLLDLKAQFDSIRDEVMAAVHEVFESQGFILGPSVEAFEQAAAAYCGTEHAVGVSSGTDALLVAMMAEGIGPGDEVICPTFSFFATAGSIARLGAKPVFVDIEPDGYNLDPQRIAEAITKRTRAIMPVHLYGQAVEMEPLVELARMHGLVVIEDAAQAIGSEYHGKRAGNLGDYGCFSFFPSKNLGGAGDGGLVTTNDAERAARLRALRMHGETQRYHHRLVGGNFRLDALQAAVLSVKLRHLDAWTQGRQRNAARYRELFGEAGLADGAITLPVELPQRRHIYNQFVIRVSQRDKLAAHLRERGIGHAIYYPVPLNRQECFAYLGLSESGNYPVAEQAAAEVLALPIYPELSDEQLQTVAQAVIEFVRASGAA